MNESNNIKINNNKKTFLIPYRIYLIQGFLNNLIAIFILMLPIIIFGLFCFLFSLFGFSLPSLPNHINDIIAFILINFFFIYIIVVFLKYYRNQTFDPTFKFYIRFRTYFLRKHILKSMVCPNCGGNFLKYESKNDSSQFVEDFVYNCKSCQNIYSLEKREEFIRPKLCFKKIYKKNNRKQ